MNPSLKRDEQPKVLAGRMDAYGAIDRAIAQAYEAGFEVAERQHAERAEQAPRTPFGDEMHALCDRLMVFQKTIGTADHRYVMLGEIIGDFQRALSGETRERERDERPRWVGRVAARDIEVGDDIEWPIAGEWIEVQSYVNRIGERRYFMFGKGSGAEYGLDESVLVRRK